MFYDSTIFNEVRLNNEVDPDAVFIINDIELVVPPSNIIVNKEDMFWNWKTLRSNISTKVSSGQGFCQASVNIIFTPDLILHLHRLIVQIKNSPFCFVENQFLRDSIVPTWDSTKMMAFCVSSFFVNSVPGLPGTFRVQLDLKWFNYEPYSSNYVYKRDFLTFPIREGTDIYQYTIPTIIGRDLETSHVKIKLSSEEMKKYYSDFASLSESNFTELINEKKSKDGPRTLLENFTGFIFDGMALPNVIMPSAPCLPFHSNIYKRYINDLQIRALYDNFNIDFYKEIERHFGVQYSREGNLVKEPTEEERVLIQNYLNSFTIGEKLIRKNSMSYRNVFSLHSSTDEVTGRITELMHGRHLNFDFHYKEFKKLAVPPFIERIKSKIMKDEYLNKLNLQDQRQTVVSKASANAIYNAYKDEGGGTKAFENHSDKTMVVNAKFEKVDTGTSDENGQAIFKQQRVEGTGQDIKITGHQEKALSLNEFNSGKGMLHPPVGNLKDRSLKPYVNSGFGWRTLKDSTGKTTKDANHNGIDFAFSKLGKVFTLKEIQSIINNDPERDSSLSKESEELIRRDLQELLIFDESKVNLKEFYGDDYKYAKAISEYKDRLHPVFAADNGVIINTPDIGKYESTKGQGLNLWIQHSSGPDGAFLTSAYMHLSYITKRMTKGGKVTKGEIIGFVGNSGGSKGPHLHFGLQSTVPGVHSNLWIPPYPILVANFEEASTEPEAEPEEQLEKDLEQTGMALTGKKSFSNLTKQEKEVLATFVSIQESMLEAGWKPYLKDLNTNNTWEKTGTIALSNIMGVLDSYEEDLDGMKPGEKNAQELEDLKEAIFQSFKSLSRDASLTNLEQMKKELYDVHSALRLTQNLIVTGVGAGFSNIIASIPILDFEFPTTQHLGQMEPSYNFEIQMIADLQNPNGLPLEGKILNELFQTMQENARSFRQVPDGSNFNLDCFITRLMGSYLNLDLDVGVENGMMDMVPRFVLNRSSIETVEGSPGRSLMNLEIGQSNPFFTEKIQAVNAVEEKVEETAYKEVLKKLHLLQLTDHGKTAALLSFFNKENNGVYTVNDWSKLSEYWKETLGELSLGYGQNKDSEDRESIHYLKKSDIDKELIGIFGFESTLGTYIEQGNVELLDMGLSFSSEEIKSLISDSKESQSFFRSIGVEFEVTTNKDGSSTVDFKKVAEDDARVKNIGLFESVGPYEEENYFASPDDLIDFYDKHPSYESLKEGTGEATIKDLRSLWSELNRTLMMYRFSIAEPEVGGIHFDQIAETLYDINYWTMEDKRTICDEIHYPSLWRNFIYWTAWFLRSNIGDTQPDPLDGGLGWTKSQLENYLNSIDYQGLFTTDSQEAADKTLAATQNTEITIIANGLEYPVLMDSSDEKLSRPEMLNVVKFAIQTGSLDKMVGEINQSVWFNSLGDDSFTNAKRAIVDAYIDQLPIDDGILDLGNQSISLENPEDPDISQVSNSQTETALKRIDNFLDLLNLYFCVSNLANAEEGSQDMLLLFEGLRLKNIEHSYRIIVERGEETKEFGIPLFTLATKIKSKIDTELRTKGLGTFFKFGRPTVSGLTGLGSSSGLGLAVNDYSIDSLSIIDGTFSLEQFAFELKENATQIDSIVSKFKSPVEIFRESMAEIFYDDFIVALELVDKDLVGILKKEKNEINFENIYYKDSEFIAKKLFSFTKMLENEIYDSLYTNSMGGWLVGAGAYLGDKATGDGSAVDGEDVNMITTGETLSQLVGKATLFLISRTMIYTKYLNHLSSENINVGVYDSQMNTTFAALKPFAKLAFTKKQLLENKATGPMMAFSSLEVYFNKFVEWLLEPRLINNVGLDIKMGAAGRNDNIVENYIIDSLATFIGTRNPDDIFDQAEIESTAHNGKAVFQNKAGVASGALEGAGAGYYAWKIYQAGAMTLEGASSGALALVGLVPTLAGKVIDETDEILEVGREDGRFDADSNNKILVTNMLMNPANSATASYYRSKGLNRFGSVHVHQQDGVPAVTTRMGPGGEMIVAPDPSKAPVEGPSYLALDPFSTDDVRTDPDVKKFLNLNNYVDLEIEKMKLEVVRGKLEAIVKTVLGSRDLCYALDIKYGEFTGQSFSKPPNFGDSAYPDINIPKHPFYQESNIEMGPAFYMWNIYDDGGSKVTKQYMEELQLQSEVMLYGAHYHQERMMKGLSLDPNYNRDVLQGITDSNANIVNDSSTLKIRPEASHNSQVPVGIEDDGVRKTIQYQGIGETTTPFFEVGSVERNDELIKSIVTLLKDSEGKSEFEFKLTDSSSKEYTKKFTTAESVEEERKRLYSYVLLVSKKSKRSYVDRPFGWATVQAVSAVPDMLGDAGSDLSEGLGSSLLGVGSLPTDGVDLPHYGTIMDKIPNTSLKRIPKIQIGDLDPLSFSLDGDLQQEQYKKMISKVYQVKDIENMFGNGAGYTGELITGEAVETTAEMADLLKDVQVKSFGAQDSYTQSFKPENLSTLAKASSADFFSEKKRLDQAFPTFKLYFIEEDEFETRFLNLDDFYSFNGVKSFTVTRSRDNPGDTAVIALQNVAGTLDGTKRGGIVDLDYFSEKRTKRIERLAKKKGEKIDTLADNFNQNPNTDQPFDTVVLRPGMNVQLRCGYSNNPDLLEVLLSGRITDVSITGSDGMEIIVQSFGVELISQTKRFINENEGLNELTDKKEMNHGINTFNTTHQLLGQMMLEPELKHFGRWERGRLFQYGEMQDSSLDFFRYKEAIKPSTFRDVSSVFTYVAGSIVAIGAITLAFRFGGVSALQRGLNSATKLDSVSLLRGASGLVNPRFFGGAFTYLMGAAGRGVSAATYAGRRVLRGRLDKIAPAHILSNSDEVVSLAARQGIPESAVALATRVLTQVDDLLKSGGNWGKKVPAKIVDDLISGSLDLTKTSLLELKVTLQNSNYGTKAAGIVIKNIDEVLEGMSKGTLTYGQAGAKIKAIATGAENIALFTASPASPLKSIVLNGYKSLSTKQILGFATVELLTGGFAAQAVAFKLSMVYGAMAGMLSGVTSSFDNYRDAMKRWMTKELAYFKLRPSDDNLFCPSPLNYMHMLKVEEPGFWATVKYSALLSMGGVEASEFDKLLEQWKNQNPLIHLKQVTMADAEYYLENKTIWDIFHEMTLRHPGYVYAALPYGKEFRYTMFFGVPSQRYWSKGVSNGYIQRMNSLRENLVNPPDSIEAVIARTKLLYGEEYAKTILVDNYRIGNSENVGDLVDQSQGGGEKYRYYLDQVGVEELLVMKVNELKKSLGRDFGTEYDAVLDTWLEYHSSYGMDQTRQIFMEAGHEGIIANDPGRGHLFSNKQSEAELTGRSVSDAEALRNNTLITSLQQIFVDYKNKFKDESITPSAFDALEASERIKFHSRVVKEYLTGLENRFVPFRRYHQIRSDRDIVRNNISISTGRAVNSVNIYYKDLTTEKPSTKSVFMKASASLSDQELNTANVTNYLTNVRSHSMALRYGMGSLIYGMKEMYSGEILVLGNPRIKPWDVCFVLDNYNDMSGPIEVKSVTHMFSFETGFLTEIVPNALVFANETSSLPVMEALKVYLAGALSLEFGTNKTPREADVEIRDIDADVVADAKSKEQLVAKQHAKEKGLDFQEFLEKQTAGTFLQKIGVAKSPKFNGYNLSFKTSKYMEARYKGLQEEGLIIDKNGQMTFDYSKLIPEEFLNDKGIFNGDKGIDSYLETIESYADTAATGLLSYHYATNPTDHIFKNNSDAAGIMGLSSVGMGGFGVYSMFGGLGPGRGGVVGAVSLGAAGLLYLGASYSNAINFKSHTMDKFSASYLIGAPIIFSRLTQEEAVTVIPLVKEGRPLSTVTSSRDPLSLWKNVFGKFINVAQQSILGAMGNINENKAMGNEFWTQLASSNQELLKDQSFQDLKKSGALYRMVKD